jgi:hypothetical protein
VGEDVSDGVGTYGETYTGVAVAAIAFDSSGLIFYGHTPEGNYCKIDYDANLSCSGQITGGQNLQIRHRTNSGHHVLAYTSESTSATIEDFGTAQLVHGVGSVKIEPTFASTVDRNDAYYVFLTPLGDTRGLYVSLKTPSGFQVRETQGGRSSLGFDYRIVAHPADAGSGRLPSAPVSKTPYLPNINIPRRLGRQP